MSSCSTTTPINKDMVESVQLSKNFTHTVFTEREGIDTKLSDITGTWDSNTGKLKLGSKLTQPGIYTGEVTITYKDKTKETHTVTLRKTPSDSIKFNTDVRIGSIFIDGLKINNGSGDSHYHVPVDKVKLNGKTGKAVGSGIEFNIFDVVNGGKLKHDTPLELTVTYGKNNEYTLTSKIVLTEENETKIKEVISTNSMDASSLKSKLESSLKSNFNGMEVTVPKLDDNTETYTLNVGGNPVLTYEQSLMYGVTRGALITPSTDGENVTISVNTQNIPVSHKEKNNVPFAWVDEVVKGVRGPGTGDSNDRNGFIGDYYFSIGDQHAMMYFDATSDLIPKVYTVGENTGRIIETDQVSDAISEVNDVERLDERKRPKEKHITFDTNGKDLVLAMIRKSGNQDTWGTIPGSGLDNINLNLKGNLEHGYSSVTGMFTVDYTDDKNKIDTLNASVTKKAEIKTEGIVAPVKASVIVVADIFDGISNQAMYERLDDSHARIIFPGAKDSFKGTVQLVVNGVSYAPSGYGTNAKDLEFTVISKGMESSVDYMFTVDGHTKFTGTVSTGMIEVFDASGSVKNADGDDKVEIVTNVDTNKFKGTVLFDGNENKIVNLSTLANGAHKVEVKTTTGKYQGTYTDTLQLQKSLFTVMVRDPKSVSNSSASVVIDANFPSGFDMSKVTGGVIQYAEKTVNGNTTTWSSFKDSTTKIEKSDVKEEAITKTISGLTSGKTYKFRVLYNYANGTNTQVVYSNESGEVTIQTTGSGSGTITGSGSGTVSGTSITGTGSTNVSGNAQTTTITSTTSNTSSSSNTALITLPTGFTFDVNTSPVVTGITYVGKDGKTVVETQEQFKNVQAKFTNGRLELIGLVPGKMYSEIMVRYTDSNRTTKTINIKDLKITNSTQAEQYLANVYEVVFNRPADETGYHFHFKNLTDKTTALKEFLLNMLTEKEFVETYKTPETKIEALYSAIVARTSDEAGKKFWVEEYKKALTTYGTESLALQAIADRMVNETELKELANRINFKL